MFWLTGCDGAGLVAAKHKPTIQPNTPLSTGARTTMPTTQTNHIGTNIALAHHPDAPGRY